MTTSFGIFEEGKPEEPRKRDEAQIARNALAAEHFVCADLLSKGVDAYIVPGRPYDIVIDTGDLFRIQVKGTARKQQTDYKRGRLRYRFGGTKTGKTKLKRGGIMLGKGLHAYKGRVDAFAFVALDIRRILYVPINAITSKVMISMKIPSLLKRRCHGTN